MKLKWFCLVGSVLALLLPVSAEYAEIVIDGDFSDWDGISSVTNDPLDHVAGGVDFKEMWVANDDDYLYIRYTFHVPANPLVWNVRTYIDGDNNQNTGYHPAHQGAFGAEIGVENNTAFQLAGGVWIEGRATNSFIKRAVVPEGVVTQLEFCVSRAVTGVSNDFAGVSLISSDTIRILLQDERGTNYDYMPDTQGISYTFAPKPPPPSYYKKITIDGDFSDWEGVPAIANLPGNNTNRVDWKEMWIANDEEYLYIKYTLHQPVNPHDGYTTHFFFDGDNKKSSGYNVGGLSTFGSELMLEKNWLYQQAGGSWADHELTQTVKDADIKQSPYNSSATEFEFRVARAVTGNWGDFEGLPLFTSDTIRILALDETGTMNKYMPHKKGATYAFASKPPPSGTLIQLQ